MRGKTSIGASVLICGLVWLTCSASPTAFAGTYEVNACNDAPGAVNHSWTWSTSDTVEPSHYASHVDCPDSTSSGNATIDQERGLSTTDALGLSSGAQPGTNAGWTFTATAGTTITGITYEHNIGHQLDPFNDWSPALRADGTIIPTETCLDSVEDNETCSVGGPPGSGWPPGILTNLTASQLTLGIICQAPTGNECVTGATQHKVWAAMYGAKVTINDPTAPTLDTPTGPLWEPGEADGFHKGDENITTSAEDVGGGVQNIALSADGQPVQAYTAPCDFTYAQPCPLSTGAQTLTLPTNTLTDGVHTIGLIATDAAGNQSTLATKQITIDNEAPAAPIGLAATSNQAGGSTFTATWTDPTGQVAPITAATYQVCPTTGPGVCGTPTSTPAGGPATITVPGPGTWTLAVWLTDAAGNGTPTNAAHTTLTVQSLTLPSPGSGQTEPGSKTPDATKKTTIHIRGSLRGRELIARVSGPQTGRVRVSYTGQIRGRTVATATKTIPLKHGRLTAIFKLSPKTATHAQIRISAKLGHQLVVSTLHRPNAHPSSTLSSLVDPLR